MATFEELCSRLSPDDQERGRQFERISKWLLTNASEYADLVEEVWLWRDYPGAKSRDIGIDLVVKARCGELWAVQAKAYDPAYWIKKEDLDSFLSTSARSEFSFRLLLATTDRIGPNARETMSFQEKPVHFVGATAFSEMDLNWPESPDQLLAPKPEPHVPLPHQIEAIAAAIEGLKVANRGQIIMACGTGKTLVSLWVAEGLQAERTLVLVPSLSLLKQTYSEWGRNRQLPYETGIVCSDESVGAKEEDEYVGRVSDLGFPVTTDAKQIREFLSRPGRRVVFATYQSSPVIAEAMCAIESQTEAIKPFDLVIADEAHRCAGPVSSEFATVLDNNRIPAHRRLFMTATPRHFVEYARRAAKDADWELVSMDDPAQFGNVLYTLSFGEAIKRSLLTDYQVAVIVLDEEEYLKRVEQGSYVSVDGKNVTNARLLAQQVGLAKLMRDPAYDLRRVVSFHSRVKAAREFADSFPQLVASLPEDERPNGTIWAELVSGKMAADERTRTLRRLKNVGADKRGLITNVRCLTEGVDVPSLDGVAFIDPRGSKIDIVQAVGRAIRLSKDKKIGTILVPVVVRTGDEAGDVIASSPFENVWSVLRALRAHDEVLAEELDTQRQLSGELDGLGEPRRTETEGAGSLEREARALRGGLGAVVRPTKVRFILPARLELPQFAQQLTVRLVERTTSSFEYGLGQLKAYIDSYGNAEVVRNYTSPSGFTLGSWLSSRRAENRRGELTAKKVSVLDALGVDWDPHDKTFVEGLSELRAYVADRGNANVHSTHMTASSFPLGIWLNARREENRHKKLSAMRISELNTLGVIWEQFDALFEEGVCELKTYVATKGNANVAEKYKAISGFALGAWLVSRRKQNRCGKLSEDRIKELDALGVSWNPSDVRFEEGVRELQAYVSERGNADVRYDYKSATGFALGKWICDRRKAKRNNKLSIERSDALAGLGVIWETSDKQFDAGVSALLNYVAERGDANVPNGYKTSIGFPLGVWLQARRAEKRRNELSLDKTTTLKECGVIWKPLTAAFDAGARELRGYVAERGDANVPKGYETSTGFALGTWVASRRWEKKHDKLSVARIEVLEELSMVWEPRVEKRVTPKTSLRM